MPLYGPFLVLDLSAAPTTSIDPDSGVTVTTYPLAAGLHYTADAPTWSAFEQLLTPYLATHAWPLQFVMAGDDPANPTNTWPIVFADQATANTVLAQTNPAAAD